MPDDLDRLFDSLTGGHRDALDELLDDVAVPGMEKLGGVPPPIARPPAVALEPVTVPSLAGDIAGGIARGAANTALSVPKALSRIPGGLQDQLAQKIEEQERGKPAPATAPQPGQGRREVISSLQKAEEDILPAPPITGAGKFSEMFGSTLPYLASGVVGPAGPAVLGVLGGAEEALSRADQSGKPLTPAQRALIGAAGAVIGSTESIPIGHLLGRLRKAGVASEALDEKKLIQELFPSWIDYLKSAAKQGAEEGAQEGFSGVAQDALESSYGGRPVSKIGENLAVDVSGGAGVGALLDVAMKLAGTRVGRGKLREAGIDPDRLREWQKSQATPQQAPPAPAAAEPQPGTKQGETEPSRPAAVQTPPDTTEKPLAAKPDARQTAALNAIRKAEKPVSKSDLVDALEIGPREAGELLESLANDGFLIRGQEGQRKVYSLDPKIAQSVGNLSRALTGENALADDPTVDEIRRGAAAIDTGGARVGTQAAADAVRGRKLAQLAQATQAEAQGGGEPFGAPWSGTEDELLDLVRRDGLQRADQIQRKYRAPQELASRVLDRIRAESAPASAPAPPRQAAETPRPPKAEPAYGRDTKISIPGEDTSYPARYAIRELDDTFPSHDPISFQGSPGYEFENDRDYQDPENAARVLEYSNPERFDPDFLVTESPTAEHGPTVIDPRGNALGGNNRLMTLNRVYQLSPPAAERYREALRAKAPQLGIDPAELDRFERPVLVRERSTPVTAAQKEITDYNKKGSASLRPGEQAVTDGKRLSARSVARIVANIEDAGPDSSLADALRGDNGAGIIESLIGDGILTDQERAGMIDERGVLTQDAKNRIGKALVGRLFESPSQFNRTPPELRNKLERIAPHVLRVEGRQGWALTKDVRDALDVIEALRAHGARKITIPTRGTPLVKFVQPFIRKGWLPGFEGLVHTEGKKKGELTDLGKETVTRLAYRMQEENVLTGQGAIGEQRTFTPRALAIARTLRLPDRAAASAFRRYANDESYSRPGAQSVMFTPPTSEEAFRDAFEDQTEALASRRKRTSSADEPAIATFRPGTRGRPGTIYGNQRAIEMIAQMAGMDGSVMGGNVVANAMRPGLAEAQWRIHNGGLSGRERSDLRAVVAALKPALDSGHSVLFVRKDGPLSEVKGTLRHERFHEEQRRHAGFGSGQPDHIDTEQFFSNELAQRAGAELLLIPGYDKVSDNVLAAEIGAFLAEGPTGWELLGLTEEQARELAYRYARALIARHGTQVVFKFRSISPILREVFYGAVAETSGKANRQGQGEPAEALGWARRFLATRSGPTDSGAQREAPKGTPGRETAPQAAGDQKPADPATQEEAAAIRSSGIDADAGPQTHSRRTRTASEEAARRGGEEPRSLRPSLERDLSSGESGDALASRRPRDNRTGNLFESLFADEEVTPDSPPASPTRRPPPQQTALFTPSEEQASREAAKRDRELLQKDEAQAIFASPLVPRGKRGRPAQPGLFDAPDPQASLFGGEERSRQPSQAVKADSIAPAAAPGPYKYASTQVNLPGPVAQRILEAGRRIPDSELAEDGRENQPHITIKYGLHGNDPGAVRALVEGEGPIRVKLGKTSLFENGDADVLKVDVESADLARLNQRLRDELANTETHPEGYKPHVTIAYLKPGQGRKYAGKPVPGVSGQEITFDRIAFSNTNGEQVEIPLGAGEEPPRPSRQGGNVGEKPPFAPGDLVEANGRWQWVVGHEDGRALVVDAGAAFEGRTSPEDATFASPNATLVASLGTSPQLNDEQLRALDALGRRNPQWGGSLGDRVRAYREASEPRRANLFWDIVTGYPRDLLRPILQQAGTNAVSAGRPGSAAKPPRMALTGDTYRHRNQIKKLGGKWDGEARAWILDDTAANRDAVRRMSATIAIAPVQEASRQPSRPDGAGETTPSRPAEVQTNGSVERILEQDSHGLRHPDVSTPDEGQRANRELGEDARGGHSGLAEVLPEAGAGTEEARDSGEQRAQRGRAGEPGVQAIPSGRPEPRGSDGTRSPGVAEPAESLSLPAAGDYRIPDQRAVGGSPAKRYERNVAAIRLLRQLEAERRLPTRDEQDTLAGYVGWGAVPQVFAGIGEWADRQKELRGLLSETEYEHARRSTTNAHYTSDAVVNAMWAAMEHLGARPGMSWLEPAVGVGNFFGRQPAHLLAGARRVGIDKDTITGKIAQKLYPQSGIEVVPFEEAELPSDYFDAAISNVPFGDFGVHDPAMKSRALTNPIHNYFFAKSLQYVRPGGIIAFVTSRYTLDGYDKDHQAFRAWMDERADFLGAVRLPANAFMDSAGTKVITDIVFLRRRLPDAPRQTQRWIQSPGRMFRELTGRYPRSRQHAVNEYYTAHPENILGREGIGRGQFTDTDYTVEGQVTEAQLTEALRRILPANAFQAAPKKAAESNKRRAAEVAGAEDAKIGALFFDGEDKLHRRLSKGTVEPVSMPAGSQVRLKRMLKIRDTLVRLLDAERNDQPHGALRDLLNLEYDTFRQRFGYLSSPQNIRLMEGDPDQPLLQALESGWNGKTAQKAPIFTSRVLVKHERATKADSAQDALMITLNEGGVIDWDRMSALTGKDADTLRSELAGVVFEVPGSEGVWQTADEYLSGPVRSKLREARKHAKVEPRFESNVRALEAVQPEDIPPGQIAARLGVTWVPKETYAEFVREVAGMRPDVPVKVEYAPAIGMWNVQADWSRGTSTKWATDRMEARDLLDHGFNMKRPKVYDEVDTGDGLKSVFNPEASAAAAAKLDELQQHFQDWLFGDEERARKIARLYNDTNNDLRLRTFHGDHLTLPGMAVGIKLHPHQRAAIWRVITQPNSLLAHAVGAGKTYEMIAAGMELKRMGLINRPMYLVPNATLTSWQEQFAQLYPGTRVLVFSEKDLEKKKRQQIMARIAVGNWDAVVVPHSSFQFLPVSDALFEEHYKQLAAELDGQIAEAKEAGTHTRLIKRMEKAKERLLESLKEKRKKERQDRTVSWEQLGIDQLFVDESHEYKKLGFATKQSNVAGIDQQGNQKTFDLRMKMTHVQRHGRGVTFATGTPVTNTMGEMFSIMRYLIEPDLRSRGMGSFDEWSANFGRTVSVLEPKPEGGGYHLKDRFAKFVNLPELITLFRSFADVVTSDMLSIPRPKAREEMVVGEMSPEQEDYLAELQSRALKVRNDPRNALPDNMLAIFGDATKMALDIRLVRPSAPDHPGSRLNLAANRIYRHYQDSMRDRGTQLVFMDMGIPDGAGANEFSTYDALISKLVERGIPRAEIAYIHQAKNKLQRQKLFDQVRSGAVRVLIGSTGKMGVGVNVQERIVAMHHLDLPHRPADYEQRNGRGIRQGNKNEEVAIYTYLTAGTLDELKAASLARKAAFISQAMQGKATVREAEDVSGMVESYQAFQAATSKDPRVKRKMEVDSEVARLSAIRASWAEQRYRMRQEAAVLPASIERYKRLIETYKELQQRRDRSGRVWQVDGATFEGEGIGNEVGMALQRFWAKHSFEIAASGEPMQMATAWGFPVRLRASAGGGFAVDVEGLNTVALPGNHPPDAGTVRSVENMIKGIEAKIADFREDLERLGRRAEEILAESEKPWGQQAKLDAYLKEQAELYHALEGGHAGTEMLDDSEEIRDSSVRAQESENAGEDLEDREDGEDGEDGEDAAENASRRLVEDTSGELRLDFAVELFRAGITKFADWARRMMARFGEAHPRLYYEAKKLWRDTRGAVGDLEQGPHGPVFREFYHDAPGAIAKLREMQAGEAVGALYHPEIGDIDLLWGNKQYGLEHIIAKHKEMEPQIERLGEIISALPVAAIERSGDEIRLEDSRYRAIVSTVWQPKGSRTRVEKKWLLTAFEVKLPSATDTLDAGDTLSGGGTTTPPKGSDSSIEPSPRAGNPPLGDIWKDERGELRLAQWFTHPPQALQKLRNPAIALGKALKKSVVADALEQAAPLDWRIAREGQGAGKPLIDALKRANDIGEVSAGKRLVRLMDSGLDRLSREERFNLLDVLEGRADPMNADVLKAYKAARALTDEIAAEAEDLEVLIRVGDRRVKFEAMEDYYPHMLRGIDALKRGPVRRDVLDNIVRLKIRDRQADAEAFLDEYIDYMEGAANQPRKLLDHMVRTGQAENAADALAKLQRYRSHVKRHGSIEYAREVNLPFYDPDPKRVLPTHVVGASIRLAQIAELGQDNQVVNRHVKAIADAGGNAEWTRRAVDKIIGFTNAADEKEERISRALRSLQGFKLGMAAIPNATQTLNTLLETDLPSVAKGIKAVFTTEGRRFAVETGATLDPVLHESVKELASGSRLLERYLKAVGFSAVERANRIIAANAGAAYSERLLKDLKRNPNGRRARARLEEMGVNVDAALRRGSLSADDVLMAGKKIADASQFRARPQDLPEFASHPWGKVFFQFKSFAYQQTRFMKRSIVDEFAAGHFGRGLRNLLILAALFPLAGEAVKSLRDWLTGRERESEGMRRYLENIAAVGALGLLWDLIEGAQRRKLLDTVAGPSAGMAADLGEIVLAKPLDGEAWKKFAYRHAPLGAIGRNVIEGRE